MLDVAGLQARLKIRKKLDSRFQHTPGTVIPRPARLVEVAEFGANPGNLRMFNYLPDPAIEDIPLVVVLHGCGQTAEGYNHGAGWSTLSDRHGFALLFPEQQRSNNPHGCFNWFRPDDTRRGGGEAASIHQMIEHMVRNAGVDPARIFVTGLSAGGAMTSAMLACYPDVFAAGAIIAGLPYGAASNVQQALESMYRCPSRTARYWGDLVRAAGPAGHARWPRISIWHGGADKTVIPPNAGEIVKQWTNVHGLGTAPSLQLAVDGYPRQVWTDQTGEDVIESYSIAHMAHGTPLATGQAEFGCGEAGPFLLEAGISSSFHIVRFFGLAGAERISPERTGSMAKAVVLPAPPALERFEPPPQNSRFGNPASPRPKPPENLGHGFDLGAVITKALAAAGLMKRS